MEKLLGVVMCGGQSLRMGTDKGLIQQAGSTWVQLTHAKLSSFNIPVKVSVNANQVEAYSHLFDVDDMVIDALNIPGPLNGILSVHARYPDKDVLILACDMIAMGTDTLARLVDVYHTYPGYHYYAYHNGSFFEPLCAIYTAKALNNLQVAQLTNYSLQQVLKNADTKRLAILKPEAFGNQNTL